VLLRRVIGDVLRARRQDQHRTLREVSHAANVSLGYLSEIERGQKEASSELLAAICDALGSELSDVLRDVSDSLARVAQSETAPLPVPALPEPEFAEVRVPEPERAESGSAEPEFAEAAYAGPGGAGPGAAADPSADRSGRVISDGRISVSIRRHGPLRTTLHAVPTRRPSSRTDELAGSSTG
jgi:transcriptional regulator with XRE-family HTH domain